MKFQVGDKVVPINKTVNGYEGLESKSRNWKKAQNKGQDFLYVTGFDSSKNCYICRLDDTRDSQGDYFNESDLKHYNKITKNQRITALEKEVENLQKVVESHKDHIDNLRNSHNSNVDRIMDFEKRIKSLELIVEDLRERKAIDTTVKVEEVIEQVEDFPIDLPYEPTPNQQRAEIIEKAKKFVNENVSLGRTSDRPKIGNITYREHYYDVDFSVKGKKVTAVIWHLSFNEKRQPKPAKIGRTKCHPISVFNEHIGKAIALGRALGLDVSEFEQAVQPTLAIGQEVQNIWSQNVTRITDTFETSDTNSLGYIQSQGTDYKIINDTNTIYLG